MVLGSSNVGPLRPAWQHHFSEFGSTIGDYRRHAKNELSDKADRAGFSPGASLSTLGS
jgi:hypothetical protein